MFYYKKALNANVNDSLVNQIVLSESVSFLINHDYYNEAECQMHLLTTERKEQDAIVLHGVARLFAAYQEWDSARTYYLKALEQGKIEQNVYLKRDIYRSLAGLEAIKHSYESAFHNMERSMLYNDSIVKYTQTEAVAKANSLYNYQRSEIEKKKLQLENEKFKSYMYLLLVVFLSLYIVSAFIIGNQKRKRKEQILYLKQRENELKCNSSKQIQENERKISELEEKLELSILKKDMFQHQLLELQKSIWNTLIVKYK